MPLNFLTEAQPQTLNEAVDKIFATLDEEDKAIIKVNEPTVFHFSIGMMIRNGWNLWGADDKGLKTLRHYFMDVYNLGHADDMSSMILKALKCKVENIPFDADSEAAFYWKFWYDQRVDPLTQKPL